MTGWGLTVNGGNSSSVSTVLKKARIPIVSDSQCTQNVSLCFESDTIVHQINSCHNPNDNITQHAQLGVPHSEIQVELD